MPISWSSASSRRHSGWAYAADERASEAFRSLRHDHAHLHSHRGRVGVASGRVDQRSDPQVLLCCCLAPTLSLSLRKNRPRSHHPTIRQRRAACDRCSKLDGRLVSRAVARTPSSDAPLDDFLPIPSLSMTSSAHWMRLCSVGSARRRKTPEGPERRKTG